MKQTLQDECNDIADRIEAEGGIRISCISPDVRESRRVRGMMVRKLRQAASALAQCAPTYEGIRWQRVNDEPFEYAIQQGPHGDEFVKLIGNICLRRTA
jgi:hypothetical protein